MNFILKSLIVTGIYLLAMMPGSGAAQNADLERLYSVSGVEVDVTSRTATRARTIALGQAEEKAFRILLRRLMAEEDLGRFEMPEGASPPDYVRGIEVVEERRSNVRYIATLNITFDELKIEQLLGQQSIAYVGIAPKPALVIPLYWQDGTWLLWEEGNVFKDLWFQDALNNRIMTYLFMEGNIKERASITPDLLMQGRGIQRLRDLAKTYDVDEIIIISAKYFRNTNGQAEKLVLKTSYPLSDAPGISFDVYPGFLELEDVVLERGIVRFLEAQDRAWKAQSMTQFGEALELALIVPISGEAGWANTLHILSATPVVQDVRIIRMAMPESYLVVRFVGSTEQLALALAQKGLILMETERGWALVDEEYSDTMTATRGD